MQVSVGRVPVPDFVFHRLLSPRSILPHLVFLLNMSDGRFCNYCHRIFWADRSHKGLESVFVRYKRIIGFSLRSYQASRRYYSSAIRCVILFIKEMSCSIPYPLVFVPSTSLARVLRSVGSGGAEMDPSCWWVADTFDHPT